MSTVHLPDELVRELMTATGQPTAEAAVLEAVSAHMDHKRQLKALETNESLNVRAARASREKFDAAMSLVPDAEPAPEDRLP